MSHEIEVLPLREWRLRKYWSYRFLAEQAGVSTETLQRAERGGRVYDTTARRIADALGIKVDQVSEFAPTPRPIEDCAEPGN